MALFLKQDKMWDMPLTSEDGGKHITHWCGNILFGFFVAVLKPAFRYRADHLERLRAFEGQGAVVVANHTSFLDVIFLWVCARPRQWIRFIARDTLFGNAGGLLGQIISRVGAFPIKRDSADRTAIKRAARMLKSGEIVGIMPEGTRRGKGNLTPEIHAGAGFIAKMGKAPIVPATVRNAELVKQKGKMLRFPKITIDFGNPVLLEDFDFVDKADRLEAYTWYCMRECFAMSRNVAREEVDMVALFPDGRDFTELFADHPIPERDAAEVAASRRAKLEAAKAKAALKAAGEVGEQGA